MSYNYDGYGAAGLLAFFAIFAFVFFFIFLIYYVVSSFFFMKLFEKAGVEGKWRAWVPVYREMIFVKLGDLNPWWLLVLVGAAFVLNWIPYLGTVLGWILYVAMAVYTLMAAYRVQTKLGKETAWIILAIFLWIVWLGIVAFDRSRWNSNIPRAPWADSFLADNTVWQGVPVQSAAGGYAPPPAGAYPPAGGGYPPAPTGGYPAPGGATPPPAPPAAPPAQPPAAPPAPPAGQPPVDPPAPPTEPPAPPAEPPRV
ncbi:large exoprotein [Microbacterium sp. RD1]|uniref:large exoprotein n=1 Tax=Microbacterium sp. RD1 TaxID=3457313 RepID=UPI003FA5430F